MRTYLEEIQEKLQFSKHKKVREEILTPLKHVLEILGEESEEPEYGA